MGRQENDEAQAGDDRGRKPVRLTVDLPAALYRDLVAYAEIMARQDNLAEPYQPARLVAPMLARFMQADRVSGVCGTGRRGREAGPGHRLHEPDKPAQQGILGVCTPG
ncbi:DUF2274 domain-containing protein [Komagataeibacter rhaeticus]|nr:DUF2274 domain-containing protein [Komagataeibacter rhaeticus]